MNGEFERRRAKALGLLANSRIRACNYLPPIYSLFWRIGMEVPPPHFASFPAVFLINGVPGGLFAVGLAMMSNQTSLLALASIFAIVGSAYGMAIALYFRVSRIRNELPRWSDL